MRNSNILYQVFTGFCLLTIMALGWVMYRVAKIARCSDPIFLWMLAFLELALLTEILFF